MNKYGRVLLCGVQRFCEDLSDSKAEENNDKKEVYYKSFKKTVGFNSVLKAEDRDVYELFLKEKKDQKSTKKMMKGFMSH